MNKDTFWDIISQVNEEANQNDHPAILKATEKRLMAFPAKDIADWHSIKGVYMDLAYRNDLWAACAATQSHCTDDGFIDFRSWLISRGKDVYMNALQDPDSLASLDFPTGSADFEAYGYVASRCYTQKKAIEREGLSTLLDNYSKWAAQHSDRLHDLYELHPRADVSIEQRIADAYIRVLSNQYDVYDAVKKQPLLTTAIDEIKKEIPTKADIQEDWNLIDLPRLCPRLYEKYNTEPQEAADIGFKMEY